jgi:SM-20-related protein
MALLDLDALQRAQVIHDPCDFTVVRDFVSWADAAAIRQDFPLIAYSGLLPVEATAFGPSFGCLIEALQTEAMARLVAEKFDIDLTGRAVSIAVRGRCQGTGGGTKNDSAAKRVSALLYLNAAWEPGGSRPQSLRQPDELDDMIADVLPAFGTLVAFRRPDCLSPAREPFVRVRRYLMINWMAGSVAARRGRARPRVSTQAKRILARAEPA